MHIYTIWYAQSETLTVTTARALLSAKSKPSLTFPRLTAKNNAPVIPPTGVKTK